MRALQAGWWLHRIASSSAKSARPEQGGPDSGLARRQGPSREGHPTTQKEKKMKHRLSIKHCVLALLASVITVPGIASAGPDLDGSGERCGPSRSKLAGTPSEPLD